MDRELARKRKKGKKKPEGRSKKSFISLFLLIVIVVGGYYLIKPLKFKYLQPKNIDSFYNKSNNLFKKYAASLIVLDSYTEKSTFFAPSVRKMKIRAYSKEEAEKVSDALKKIAIEEKLRFSEKIFTDNDEEGFTIEIGDGNSVLEEIRLTYDISNKTPERRLKGKLAVIIDDIGENLERAKEFASLDFPLTLSILPGLRYSKESSKLAKEKNKEILLHCPMEPLNDRINAGNGLLKTSMSDKELIETLRKDLDSIEYESGVNNHMGSKFTTDIRALRVVMKELKKRNLFFIDSRTNPKTLAYRIAKKSGLKTGLNSLFIDKKREIPLIAKKLSEAAEIATKKGKAIVIGHPYIETLASLKMKIPELEREGIKVVFVSQLVE